jgi:hypothetical protein
VVTSLYCTALEEIRAKERQIKNAIKRIAILRRNSTHNEDSVLLREHEQAVSREPFPRFWSLTRPFHQKDIRGVLSSSCVEQGSAGGSDEKERRVS